MSEQAIEQITKDLNTAKAELLRAEALSTSRRIGYLKHGIKQTTLEMLELTQRIQTLKADVLEYQLELDDARKAATQN